jgi:phenylacetate-CoA ligase
MGRKQVALRAAIELCRLKRNEWLKPQDLERLQWRKLKRLLKYAYENVPYYHRLFNKAGISPEDIKSREDLSTIPITTKSQLQDLPPEALLAKGYDKKNCIRVKTSGSTGKPLGVLQTKEERQLADAIGTRGFMAAGLKWSDKKITIWANPHEVKQQKYWFQSLGIMRREYATVFKSETDVLEVLKKGSFDIISTYPSIFKVLMGRIEREGGSGIHPRLIFSSAELLEQPTRRQIEKTFQAPVFDFYGMEELGLVGWECPARQGFHLNIDAFAIEFVQNGQSVRAGQRGKIIVTSLYSYAMPLIRYDTEDVGTVAIGLCPCGRGLPLLKHLEGRFDDILSLPDGRPFPPTGLTTIMRRLNGIRQYKVIQEELNKLSVYLVLKENHSSDILQQVERGIKECFSEALVIKMRKVREIPLESSGKFRPAVSRVPPKI